MGQLFKLWWMAFWRMALFVFLTSIHTNPLTIGIIAFIVAFVVRYGFKRTLMTAPIWRAFNRQNPLVDLRPRKRAATTRRAISTVDTDYAPGALTGYEPQRIEAIKVSDTYLKHGTPGVGLSSSGFGAEAIALGQRGEENFAKSLSVALNKSGRPIIETTDTFWSVGMPSKSTTVLRDPDFESDIDCIVVSANTIYLLDLKYYTGGNVEYRSYGDQLLCISLATGNTANTPKKMSRNMAMAHERFTALFPKMNVESRVVFMPTERGIPRVEGVYWPGNIPAVGLMGILDELSRVDPASVNRNAVDATRKIARLLKN
jgi:hypothetical protein